MSIEIIPNQPINLDPYTPDDCNLGDGKQYCTLYNSGDIAYLQWKLAPCGSDLVCDPNLNGLLSGNNLVGNGTFTGDASSWDLTVFVYNSNNIRANSTAAGASASQSIYGIVSGTQYVITYTVSSIAHTALALKFGSGHTLGINSTAGTHSETFTVLTGTDPTDFIFQAYESTPGAGVSVTIDNIIVETVADNTCITYNTGYYGNGWSASEDSLCHTSGSADSVSIDVPLVDLTGYQQIIVKIENYVSGDLSLFVNGTQIDWYTGTSVIQTVSGNGIFTTYSTATTGMTIVITSSPDFEGCITGVSVYELSQNYIVTLTDMDGNYVDDLTGYVTYTLDRATLAYDTSLSTEGCYRIQVIDPCDTITGLTEINTDVPFNTPGSWTMVEDIGTGAGVTTTVVSGGKLTQSKSGGSLGNSAALNTYVWTNGYYVAQVEITTGTINSDTDLYFYYPLGSYLVKAHVVSNTTYTVNILFNVVNNNPSTIGASGNLYNKFGIGMYCRTGGATNELASASVKIQSYNANGIPYLSNCISINSLHDCAKLIEGTSDSAANYVGFIFGAGIVFRLSARIRFLKFNSTYPIEASDSDHSDGTRRLIAGRREKYYEGQLDFADENTQDWISAAIMCDYFRIDGVRYYVKPDDYKPEWSKEGTQQLAQSRIALRKRTSTIYKTN